MPHIRPNAWVFIFTASLVGCAASSPGDPAEDAAGAEDPHLREGYMLSDVERASHRQLLAELPDDEQRYQRDLAVWVKAHQVTVPPTTFKGNRLVNVIDYFHKTTDMPLDINWPAMEEIGIDRDSPVTLTIGEDESLTASLDRVIRQVGVVAQFDPIDYSVQDQRVVISTLRLLRTHDFVRMYPIGDLVEERPVVLSLLQDRAMAIEVQRFYQWLQEDFDRDGDDAGEASLFFADGGDDRQTSRAERVEMLITLIQDEVGAPEEWVDLQSTAREIDGVLIVRTHLKNHVRIEQLLSRLRQAFNDSQVRRVRRATVMVMLLEAEMRRFADPPNLEGAWAMVERALEIAPADPLVRFYAQKMSRDIQTQQQREAPE